MTTTDPPTLKELPDEITRWRAPRPQTRPPRRGTTDPPTARPSRANATDRWRGVLAFGAVALCVLCTVLTVVWHRQAQSNRADATTSRAAAVGAASASVELRGQLDQLTAQLTELQTQKDAQKVDFLRSIDDRDRLRDQLTQTELHLADLRSKVDGTYASVLQQGNTMALLDDCLRGVGRVLNLAAVDANDAAAAELFAHYGSCVEANKAIEGSG